jgi:hypothetical protein
MSLSKTGEHKSPARLAEYHEHVYPHGSPGSSPNEAPKKVKKISIDHLGIDVPTEEMLRDLFNEFDSNHNGFIDRNEFREMLRGSFDNFGAPMEEKDIDRLFSRLDGGNPKAKGQGRGDGKLSFDEFCVLVLSRLGM